MRHSDVGPNERRLRELREERMRRAQAPRTIIAPTVADRPSKPPTSKRAKKGKKR